MPVDHRGSPLAAFAALLADPTRAAFCSALLDGRAWTAGELARAAGVAPSTASEHLSRLIAGGLLTEERQGRHRYVRLASPSVATLIEDLTVFAEAMGEATAPTDTRNSRPAPRNLREATRQSAEARARTCYDHLAGRLGVAVADALLARGLVTDHAGLAVTERGHDWLAAQAIELPPRTGRPGGRPVVRGCLDWTERRSHLGGALGAALCRTALDRAWVERIGSGRALRVTPDGCRALHELLGVEVS
ncbi:MULTISPECIES: ArsR/SmtB family transcription factor [Kitasatospora]|uniref:Winged helix-turn-helix domain-containing protein n=1 Tax=Kitasatospora cathayae TaxID=3004092 RepID=A0ABY7Q5R9_9ACTN|nr:winged helix-turn-helix domain-containing protein [Kitasatospora sp. HUAS 3-15]WBP88010.1 winged helix-turn-helix domain-containing protein [Kitasatospora sp. HUAS 3-15]